MSENRICLECGEELVGRVDKKFCSDYCRNVYNNKTTRFVNNYIRKVNRILKRNRKIMAAFYEVSKKKVSNRELIENGFNFRYFTNTYSTKEKKTYYYCYDFGYLELGNEYTLIVEKKDYI